jgi:hypothetical protein
MQDHHCFQAEQLLSLLWSHKVDLKVQRSDGHHSEFYGYHEATFEIGPDETGHILIPDTSFEALKVLAEAGVLARRKAAASAGY